VKPDNPEMPSGPAGRLAELLRLKQGGFSLVPLPGDVSTRRFFRILDEDGNPDGKLVMLYPPGSQDDIDRFLALSRIFRGADLPCPETYAADPEAGLIVVEDLGDLLLQDIGPEEREVRYNQALDLLVLLQDRIPPDLPGPNPPFDRDLFLRELRLFAETVPPAAAGEAWEELFATVIDALQGQPRVFCHRDYHCRNLLLKQGILAFVDFQDARQGPYSYDPVSLIHDPYASLSRTLARRLREYYRKRRGGISPPVFARDCDMMLLQRLLKAAGTYGSVFRKTGNDSYLRFLAPCRGAVRAVLESRNELIRFLPLLKGWKLGSSAGDR